MNGFLTWSLAAGASVFAHLIVVCALAATLAETPRAKQAAIEFTGEPGFSSSVAETTAEPSAKAENVESSEAIVAAVESAEVVEAFTTGDTVSEANAPAEAITETAIASAADIAPADKVVSASETIVTVDTDPTDSVSTVATAPQFATSITEAAVTGYTATDVTGLSTAVPVGDSAAQLPENGSTLIPENTPETQGIVAAVIEPVREASSTAQPAAAPVAVVAVPEPTERVIEYPAGQTNASPVPQDAVTAEVTTAPENAGAAMVQDKTQTAMLLPGKPSPPEQQDNAQGIAAYLKSYRGGSCTLITPKSIGTDSAEVDGIGVDPDEFEVLSGNFRLMVGVHVTLRTSMIEQLQCPAIELVKAVGVPSGPVLTLGLERTDLASGEMIAAEIRNFSGTWLSVLIVDDDGMVSDVSQDVDQSGAKLVLQSTVTVKGDGSGKNQLLIAVSSRKPIEALAFKGQAKAEDVLRPVIEESKRAETGTGIALAVFRVN
jgi:hypothetical protein